MSELFGTDGVRGIPGQHPFVEAFIERMGYWAVTEIMASGKKGKDIPCVVIGRDSRGSGEDIGAWLRDGIEAAGCRVLDIGIAPTPAVSYLAAKHKALCGVVISASHNPAEFNGIKFFSSKGIKLDRAIEKKIEARLAGDDAFVPASKSEAAKLYRSAPELVREYEDFIVATLPPGVDFKGLKVTVDCANGAAYRIAPEIFRRLGAEITVIGDAPDGKNINHACGALETEAMRRRTAETGAHCGVSLDGDADRAIFSDETGAQMDGDDLMAMAAVDLKNRGRLNASKAVVTVMSNFGLIKYLQQHGISTVEVPVGDKYVSEAMEKEDLYVGGESSGHMIFREFAPTGDGILTAVQIISALKRSGRKMSQFRMDWTRYPSVLKAVKVAKKVPLDSVPGFNAKMKEFEAKLDGQGRILVRYSGTEPKLRVLVEGADAKLVHEVADAIVEFYKKQSEGALCR